MKCYCGRELKLVLLPKRLRQISGEHHIYVHAHSGDTRCYPESTNPLDANATAEPAV